MDCCLRADLLLPLYLFRDYDYLLILLEKRFRSHWHRLMWLVCELKLEVLAGIGVFAALGFMATASGQEVSEVAKGGIGLAFFAFPTIINKAPFGEC